jgi:hypothetical protein
MSNALQKSDIVKKTRCTAAKMALTAIFEAVIKKLLTAEALP